MIALYGGTFDPVHNGHLRSAIDIRRQIKADEVRLIPSRTPPHRELPGANAEQRLAMLRLALEGVEGLVVDDRETRREGVSYTIDTLKEIRSEVGPQTPLCFMLGVDAFALIDTWHSWPELTDFVHLVVIDRPDVETPQLPEPVLEWLKGKEIQELADMKGKPRGAVIHTRLTQWPVSATEIRARCRAGLSIDDLVPAAVESYIAEHGLYR